MTENALFTWTHPLANITDTVCIGFLNITSLSAHAADLKADQNIQNLTALCLTETHISSMSDAYLLPGYNPHHVPSEHGLAMFIKKTFKSEKLNCPFNIQIMSCVLHVPSGPLNIVLVYRPPNSDKALFLSELSKVVSCVTNNDVILGGDFNMSPHDPALLKMAQKHQLHQCIPDTPTHRQGNTLDLIFTTLQHISAHVFPLPYTDHYLTWLQLTA